MESSPVIIPSGTSVPQGNPPESSEVELNAEDERFCKAMGYSKEEWAKIKGGK